ncbi:MAG: tyrosine-type recombinase/integrase [Myxococcota bacterium]
MNGCLSTSSKQIPTFAAFEADFLAFCASPMASSKGANRPSSIDEKKKNLRCHIIPAFGARRLDSITTRDVDAFGMELAKTRSRATVANIMGTLKRMLTVAKRWGVIDTLPAIQTNKGKPDQIECDQFFSFEETDRLLDAASTEHYALMLVAIRTGLRTGELRGLRWSDLDLDGGWLHVRRQIDERDRLGPPKNGKPRLVELSWDAVAVLRDHPKRGTLVFPDPDGEPFAVNALERAVKAACKRAGLLTEGGTPKRLGGHALRHTWASHAMMHGIPTRVVMSYGGWGSLAMLERYSHLAPQDAQGQMDKLASNTRRHAPISGANEQRRTRTGSKTGSTGGVKRKNAS